MPIDSTTSLRYLALYVGADQCWWCSCYRWHIGVLAKKNGRGDLLFATQTAHGTYDVNNSEVAEVISRVKAGTIPVYYVISDYHLRQTLSLPRPSGAPSNAVLDSELPEVYHHLRNQHPFRTNYVVPDKSRGPYIDIFYQRSVAAPTAVAVTSSPSMKASAAIENRVAHVEGWLLDPPTGTDTLYWNSVRYGVYSDHEPWTSADSVETGDIEWSVDHAATWLTVPPTDYATVTHVRVLNGSDYIGLPVRSDPDPDKPVYRTSPSRPNQPSNRRSEPERDHRGRIARPLPDRCSHGHLRTRQARSWFPARGGYPQRPSLQLAETRPTDCNCSQRLD